MKMEEKKNILTYEGLKKYEDELQDLKVNKRQEVAQKIKEAREQGDLSENAEYDAAKDEQRDIEARIEELEKILKNAEVVDEDEVDLERINIGCRVKILDIEYNDELEYKIVGSTEANSLAGKISNESSDSFYVYVGNTSKDDYNAYANECSTKGFNVDYDKSENYYNADNAAGYHVSVNYQGNNIMTIEIDKPEETKNESSSTNKNEQSFS